jgi:hypothetical protein
MEIAEESQIYRDGEADEATVHREKGKVKNELR